MNIKFYLKSLAIPFFQELYPPNPFADLSSYFNPSIESESIELLKQGELDPSLLDSWTGQLLSTAKPDKMIEFVIDTIQESNIQSVNDLSEALNQSSRNLQRIIRKTFKLSPKELLSIFRFSETASHLKADPQNDFISALSFGYYDQSHFIREAKKLTGASPKELLTNMKLSTPDLMIFS